MKIVTIVFVILNLTGFLVLAIVNPLLDPLNFRVRKWINGNRRPGLRPLMILTHKYNDVLSLSVQLLVLALLIGFVLHNWSHAMVLTSVMFVQTTVVSVSKRLTSIDRPPQIASHVFMTSGSYPSGHSAASLSFALLVPTVLKPYLPLPVLIMIAVYLMAVALMTAYGRLYLDVHWLSDIFGGWFLATATYLLSRMLL
ncbi:MAG: phosphatase PAP2 family protein [Clostridiaceae bacterium]|nr:phosphatase PAP2 family protein [Clostridiaceae bacterium]